MEYTDQSKDFKAELLAQIKKSSCGGCGMSGGMGGQNDVDGLASKLSITLSSRIVKEWLLTLDDGQLQHVAEVIDKLERASIVELFDLMKQKGASNPFQVLGELFCNEQAEVEELPQGMVEQVSEGETEQPMVVELEKDEGIQAP